jgi:hypothetical protein
VSAVNPASAGREVEQMIEGVEARRMPNGDIQISESDSNGAIFAHTTIPAGVWTALKAKTIQTVGNVGYSELISIITALAVVIETK